MAAPWLTRMGLETGLVDAQLVKIQASMSLAV